MATSTLAELRRLYTKRALLQNKLTDIEAFANRFEEGDNVHAVKNRLNEMPKLREEHEDVCLNIILIEQDDSDTEGKKGQINPVELGEAASFEKRWYAIISNLQLILERNTPSISSAVSNITAPRSNDVVSSNVRLPVISLPEFSGAYKEWLPFFDAFNSLIHENKALDECQKFHYLKSCLKGEAYRAIDSLTISNLNYASAWTILQKRYKNERLIIQSHVQAILNSPEIVRSSAESLRKLVDDVTSNLEALKVLKVPVDSSDAFVVTIVMGKLDYQTRKEFENTLGADTPTRTELTDFLEKKCTILESMNQNIKPKSMTPVANAKKTFVNRTSHVATTKFSCHYCNKRHFINQCDKFLALTLNERINDVKKRNLCFNCLTNNHETSKCRASGCRKCQSSTHHTLLHDNETENATAVTQTRATITNDIPKASLSSISSINHYSQRSEPNVILSTAIVIIKDSSGNYEECRTLLDVGSQLNLLSEAMRDKLNLQTRKTKIAVWGVNQKCSHISESADITIRSMYYPYEITITCYITNHVAANIPTNSFNNSQICIPENVRLADPNYNINAPVDLILSAEVFWSILGTERIKLSNPNLYLSETLLGWIVGGALFNSSERVGHFSCNLNVKNDRTEINELMQKFWVQEELFDTRNNWSGEEIECDNHFVNTYQRDSYDGRFVIQLPFKNDTVDLGDSSKTALKRFISLEKRFRCDPDFKERYVKAINEIVDMGVMTEILKNENEPDSVFYLPHSGVVKRLDDASKMRIVYDGSAKTSNGMSLNDNLMTGPNLQNDLFDILVKFRIHQIVISCDIEKMFLQVAVEKAQTNFQRLLWRNSENEELRKYRLTRLVFGLTNSPYTAMRCIRQLAQESAGKFPVASRILQYDIFMDDILCGADNINEAIKIREQLIEILNRGCFNLSKWTSNDPRVLPDQKYVDTGSIPLNFEKEKTAKVLGLWWNPTDDTLHYRVEIPNVPEHLSKRIILSTIAKLYDPIGIISPVIVKAKILMQSLWALNLEWDQIVPNEIRLAWQRYIQELEQLNYLQISRKVIPEAPSEISLVAFCDASLQAYGAMIYLRMKNYRGDYESHLLCSKSRVSPVKVQTLPRLELCAALLAARLMKKFVNSINLEVKQMHYFTDSTIVLHYINANANSWQIFVANRVAQIQNLSDTGNWYHVNTNQNPADLISRGTYPKQLINCKLYWHGPEFLVKKSDEWPNRQLITPEIESEIPEKRKIALTISVKQNLYILEKFSSFTKLQRVMAYVLRFVHNLKNRTNRFNGFLSTEELSLAHNKIVKLIQNQKFDEDLILLRKGLPVNKHSKLYTLNPFIDQNGILRVGGRIGEASLPYCTKYPAVLPAKHQVTQLLIALEHISLLHAGATQTLASLRMKYWPLKAKNEVKRIIRTCIRCFRVSPKLMCQKMGSLPRDRIEPCRPFLKIGLDYFGPLYLKQGGRRSKIKVKAWVALFVCMVTKAIHLEIVSDLTSESFINALKRLVARRGKVSHIYCDNATTFVGAKSEIKQINDFICNSNTQSAINPYLSSENISWNFIPPRAPNFGGLWERLVRSAKQHLKKVTQNATLTFEEAYTLLIQIESVINSRPLCPLSNDPSDYQILTPSHFLIGESLRDLPEHDLVETPENRLSRWQRIQKLKQHFWRRWSREVLVQLQQRQKWHQFTHNLLKVGTLVLIADDTPPMVWKVGRIEQLFPGPDGVVRVALVRTTHGTYKRSVRHLAILPVENAESGGDDSVCEVRE